MSQLRIQRFYVSSHAGRIDLPAWDGVVFVDECGGTYTARIMKTIRGPVALSPAAAVVDLLNEQGYTALSLCDSAGNELLMASR